MAWKALISQFKLQHDSHRGSSPFRRAVFFRCCSCSSACHATCHECGRRYFSRYSGLQPFHKIEVFAADRRSHPRPDLPDLQVPELLELEHCALRLIQMLYLFDPASSCKMTRVCRRSKRGDIVFAYFAHAFLASPCFAFVAFAGFASLSSLAPVLFPLPLRPQLELRPWLGLLPPLSKSPVQAVASGSPQRSLNARAVH